MSCTVSPPGTSRCRRRTLTTARTAEQSQLTSSAPLAAAISAARSSLEVSARAPGEPRATVPRWAADAADPSRGVKAARAAMSAAVCAAALAPARTPTSTAATPASSTSPVNASPTRVAPPSSPTPPRLTGRSGAEGAGFASGDGGGPRDDRLDAEGQVDGQPHRDPHSVGAGRGDGDPGGTAGWERRPGGDRGPGRIAADRGLPGRLASGALREDLVAGQAEEADHGQRDRHQQRDRRGQLHRGRPGGGSAAAGHRPDAHRCGHDPRRASVGLGGHGVSQTSLRRGCHDLS